MYYVKIPLRYLGEPHELKVPEDQQDVVWQKRVKSLLEDLREGIIPSWAVATADLQSLVLLREEEQQL